MLKLPSTRASLRLGNTLPLEISVDFDSVFAVFVDGVRFGELFGCEEVANTAEGNCCVCAAVMGEWSGKIALR